MAIKQRVWDAKAKEMEYEDILVDIATGQICYYMGGELIVYDEGSAAMISYGHTDKHGIEIFEGDIIQLTNNAGMRVYGVVKFGDVERRVAAPGDYLATDKVIIRGLYIEIEGRKTFPISENYQGKTDFEIMEVIGNIYATPQLIPQ